MTGERTSRAPGGGPTWRTTGSGVRPVAAAHLRRRLTSSRWRWVLGIWTAVVAAVTVTIRAGLAEALAEPGAKITDDNGALFYAAYGAWHPAGAEAFGLVVVAVTALAGPVAGALGVVGGKELRKTWRTADGPAARIAAADAVFGALLAGWAGALVFLVAASPFVAWAYLQHGTPPDRLLVTALMTAVLLAVIVAIGLGWSVTLARTTRAAVLTAVTLTVLSLPLPYAIGLSLVQRTESVRVLSAPAGTPAWPPVPAQSGDLHCTVTTQSLPRQHSERVWWLLAADPFVVVADAAPRPGEDADWFDPTDTNDPLSAIRTSARAARLGPPAAEGTCAGADAATLGLRAVDLTRAQRKQLVSIEAGVPVWPYGLGTDLALGTAFVLLAVFALGRRTSRPARRPAPSGDGDADHRQARKSSDDR